MFIYYFIMNKFNKQFYNNYDTNNLVELLKLCKSPGIKIDIETKVLYICEIIYKYYEISTKFEKEQINKLLEFIEKQLKFEQIYSVDFENCEYYKIQCDMYEAYYEYENEKECIFGYSCGYECDGSITKNLEKNF